MSCFLAGGRVYIYSGIEEMSYELWSIEGFRVVE